MVRKIVLNLSNLHTCRLNIKTIVYREQQQQQQLTTLIQSVEVLMTAHSRRSNVIGPKDAALYSGGAAAVIGHYS